MQKVRDKSSPFQTENQHGDIARCLIWTGALWSSVLSGLSPNCDWPWVTHFSFSTSISHWKENTEFLSKHVEMHRVNTYSVCNISTEPQLACVGSSHSLSPVPSFSLPIILDSQVFLSHYNFTKLSCCEV